MVHGIDGRVVLGPCGSNGAGHVGFGRMADLGGHFRAAGADDSSGQGVGCGIYVIAVGSRGRQGTGLPGAVHVGLGIGGKGRIRFGCCWADFHQPAAGTAGIISQVAIAAAAESDAAQAAAVSCTGGTDVGGQAAGHLRDIFTAGNGAHRDAFGVGVKRRRVRARNSQGICLVAALANADHNDRVLGRISHVGLEGSAQGCGETHGVCLGIGLSGIVSASLLACGSA